MSEKISLKELEQKAWKSFFQDGLWEIYLGLLLLGMDYRLPSRLLGLPPQSSWGTVVGLVWMALAMLLLWAGKRFVTTPRIGRVTFGPRRKTRIRKVTLILTLSVLVGLITFAVAAIVFRNPGSGGTLAYIIPTVWALKVVIVFSLGAYFLDFNRLYLIGILYAVAIPGEMLLSTWTGVELMGSLAFVVPAGVILLIGATVFVRFLRDYPVLVPASD